MSILYIALYGNDSICVPLEEAHEICSPSGFTQPVCFSRYVLDGFIIRLATASELNKLPLEGEGVRHLRPVDKNRILYRFDTEKSLLGLSELGWPNAVYGEKTDQGYPLYVPEEELFRHLQERT